MVVFFFIEKVYQIAIHLSRRADKWQVQFDFSIGGVLALLPAGTFELEVDAESLGNEIVCKTLTVPAAAGVFNPGTQKLDFTKQRVQVDANNIPKEGVYRIMKHLRYTAPVPTFKLAPRRCHVLRSSLLAEHVTQLLSEGSWVAY